VSQQQDRLGWQLDGVPAVVLGSGPGIGAEIARLLVGRGAKVMLADRVEDAALATQAELAPLGETSIGIVDVTDAASLRDFFAATVDEIGRPRIVVDVVGRAQPKAFEDVTEEDWDAMLDLNLRQQFLVAKAALPILENNNSALTYIGSINGWLSSPRQVPYGAAKAGVASLTRSLAVDYARRGVRVNAVCPSVALTPRLRAFLDETGRLAQFEDSIPIGRASDPEEVAQMAVFVSSPLASYVTGQVLLVDGGASVNYQIAIMAD
jgi:NAD(P)-dependent dehydrogenase (short-subunit alcohol dehydrogenase family)